MEGYGVNYYVVNNVGGVRARVWRDTVAMARV